MNDLTKTFAKILLVAFAAFCLFTAVCCVLSPTEWRDPSWRHCMRQPCDFRLRINEVTCLRDGVNPFDVWHGDIVKKPYYPLHNPERITSEFNEPINAYTPWEYVLALPFSLLPRGVAWGVYVAFMFLCLGVLAWGGYGVGRSVGCNRWMAVIFATLPLLLVAHPIWSNFCIGNYAVPILAAIFMMCWCLDRGYDVWAGVFWAFAMIKPQNSLLLAVPLLMRGKFKTCIVAALICIVATIPASVMCGTSPVTLIMQAPAAGVGGFHGCATLPSYLCSLVGDKWSIPLAALIGLVLCVLLTWNGRRRDNWLMFSLPAILCSISWTYTTSYSFSFACVLILGMMTAWIQKGPSRGLTVMSVLAALLLPRFYTCWHGMVCAFGVCRVGDAANYAIDTTVSLLVLLLTIAFCLWNNRRESAVVKTVVGRDCLGGGAFSDAEER